MGVGQNPLPSRWDTPPPKHGSGTKTPQFLSKICHSGDFFFGKYFFSKNGKKLSAQSTRRKIFKKCEEIHPPPPTQGFPYSPRGGHPPPKPCTTCSHRILVEGVEAEYTWAIGKHCRLLVFTQWQWGDEGGGVRDGAWCACNDHWEKASTMPAHRLGRGLWAMNLTILQRGLLGLEWRIIGHKLLPPPWGICTKEWPQMPRDSQK